MVVDAEQDMIKIYIVTPITQKETKHVVLSTGGLLDQIQRQGIPPRLH